MPKITLTVLLLLGPTAIFAFQNAKPIMLVEKDGFPSGHSTPEGAACDLARALIDQDQVLFDQTCVKPFGGGQSRQKYEAFLNFMHKKIKEEKTKKTPSSGRPTSIQKVYVARRPSKPGPANYATSVFKFKDLKYVDVLGQLHDGKRVLNRTLIIQESDGKWYVHPLPASSPFLIDGLNEEPKSTQEIGMIYSLKPRH